MLSVSQFLENARNIFEAAETASRAGQSASHITILIEPGGAIHMFADSDWPLDRLQEHNGAEMVYRVSEQNGKVMLEGCSGSCHCRIESESHAHIAHELLGR